MDRLEEIKQTIIDYKNIVEKTQKLMSAIGHDTYQMQVKGESLYGLSKEIGMEFKIEKINSFEYPFEISMTIDGFKLFGMVTWEYAKSNNLVKECPMCDSKI
ncbi:MAG: hypothetical protein PHQ35_09630 [Phycisphaerae bacterium]|nr:hypothetical protein [Phycisphaerae bacterium]MDD5239976.1 hypothetical protein [Candidatus Nanoarchaeia archaeon]